MDLPGRLDAVPLTDGRVVEYWDGGDPTGAPVLFHPGTPMGRVGGAHLHDAAVETGVRIVSVSRPGYGGSSPAPPGLASVARDGLELADRLGIDRFSAFGLSGGGPFAVALAIPAPQRVRALGVAGGIGHWPSLDEPTDVDARDRLILEQAAAGDLAGATRLMEADCREEMGPLLELADESLVEAFLSMALGAPSRRSEDPTFRSVWARDLREALASYDGQVRDNLTWGCAWDVDPSDVRVPAFLWYGDDDTSTPPSHGRWLAGQIPGARLDVIPGASHGMVCFDHLPEILLTLTGRSPRG